MKKNSFLGAALSMMAALVMTACSNDDNTVETPAAPQAEVKTIPYSVTVSGGATTRATVNETDMKTLYFAAGDKLYIRGEKNGKYISGALDIQTGMGTASATFSGTLNYTGEGTPPDDTQLRGWLIGTGDKLFTITDGEVKGYTYPATYCADVATAVKEYSYLWNMADVTYASRTFTLEQQTAFLNFVITFDDGTAASTTLTTVVSNKGSVIATADVTTKTDTYGKVVAEFVLPFDTGNKLNGATVKMGDKEAISFGGADQTLEGKVYNVKRTYAAAAKTFAEVTAGDIGKIVGKDGKIYATKAAAEAVATGNAVAMIAYVGIETGVAGYTHGLALALTDESSSGMYWNDAKTACTNKNTSATVESASWMLPSKDQWNKMIDACKNVLGENGDSRDLRDGFTSVGGSNLVSKDYWSSTEYEYNSNEAWMFNFGYDCWYSYPKGTEAYPQVRACLAF